MNNNAALKYLRAYAALRQTNAWPPKAAGVIDNYLTVSLEGPAAQLISGADDALRELHHGASRRYCDWAISSEDGVAADTSHRGAARELIAVAGLRARFRFSEGRSAEAVDDLLAATTLARHLSGDGSLASAIIAQRLEQGPAVLLARNLPLLSPAELKSTAARFDALPAGASLAGALLSHERITSRLIIRTVRSAHGRDDLIKRLAALPALERNAAEFLGECGGSADSVIRHVEQLRPRYINWTTRFTLPPEEFEKEYEAEAKELGKKNPVFRLLTPSIAQVRWTEAHRRTGQALLRAAIAIQRYGTSRLNRYRDPYDDRPFEHTARAGGFRLQSRLTLKGQPLSLDVGLADR
jgi:hypothetical protein